MHALAFDMMQAGRLVEVWGPAVTNAAVLLLLFWLALRRVKGKNFMLKSWSGEGTSPTDYEDLKLRLNTAESRLNAFERDKVSMTLFRSVEKQRDSDDGAGLIAHSKLRKRMDVLEKDRASAKSVIATRTIADRALKHTDSLMPLMVLVLRYFGVKLHEDEWQPDDNALALYQDTERDESGDNVGDPKWRVGIGCELLEGMKGVGKEIEFNGGSHHLLLSALDVLKTDVGRQRFIALMHFDLLLASAWHQGVNVVCASDYANGPGPERLAFVSSLKGESNQLIVHDEAYSGANLLRKAVFPKKLAPNDKPLDLRMFLKQLGIVGERFADFAAQNSE